VRQSRSRHSPPSNDQSGQSAQDCRTEIADGLIGDQPANGEFVDVSPDTGFFETLGQAVRPARKDRTERAPEQIERLRLGRGWLYYGGGRWGSIGRARDRTGERQIATGREDPGGKSAQIATAATCVGLLMRFSPAILGVKTRRP
jgi:hypothetical protein